MLISKEEIKKLGIGKHISRKEWKKTKELFIKELEKLHFEVKLSKMDFGPNIDYWYECANEPQERISRLRENWTHLERTEGNIDAAFHEYKKILGKTILQVIKKDKPKTKRGGKIVVLLKDWLDELSHLNSIFDNDSHKIRKLYQDKEHDEDKKPTPKRLVLINYQHIADDIRKHSKKLPKGSFLPNINISIIIEDKETLKYMRTPLICDNAAIAVDLGSIRNNICNNFEKLLGEKNDDDEINKELRHIIEKEVQEGYKRAIKQIEKDANVKIAYVFNKASVVVNGLVALASIVGGAITIIFTGGGASALGLYSILKGINTLIDDIKQEARKVGEQIKFLHKILEELENDYNKKYKNIAKTEISKTIFNTLAGGNYYHTIKQLADGNEVLDKKITEIYHKAHVLSEKIDKLLISQKKLETSYKASKVTDQEFTKLYNDLEKNMNKVDKFIHKIFDINTKIKNAKEVHSKLEKSIKNLSQKEGITAKIIESSIKIAGNSLGIIMLDAKTVFDVGKTVAPIVAGAVVEIKDTVDRAKKMK